jgi:ketosteroid isomerase-like protein
LRLVSDGATIPRLSHSVNPAMPETFATPQDAEDAFYDAIDERDLNAMLAVWEASDDVACLLPMQPLVRGSSELRKAWEPMLKGDFAIEIEVLHLQWLELSELAIHYLQEKVKVAGQPQAQPPVYATNIYRKGPDGWRMLLHQNSPAPPPPGMMPPGLQMPD